MHASKNAHTIVCLALITDRAAGLTAVDGRSGTSQRVEWEDIGTRAGWFGLTNSSSLDGKDCR